VIHETAFSKHFCLDIDNVIAQTDEVMRRVIEEYTGGRVRLSYEGIKEFNYYECRDARGNNITREQWTQVHVTKELSIRALRLLELTGKRRYSVAEGSTHGQEA
jgi:predicted RNA-binding protein with RPS1 domain